MKHFVAISLVFFSLTHLAKTERVENLRALSERFCAEQRVNPDSTTPTSQQLNEHRNPFFLSNNDLTFIGSLPAAKELKYTSFNQVISDLTIRKQPKNNSP